jgi:hypothetical protein
VLTRLLDNLVLRLVDIVSLTEPVVHRVVVCVKGVVCTELRKVVVEGRSEAGIVRPRSPTHGDSTAVVKRVVYSWVALAVTETVVTEVLWDSILFAVETWVVVMVLRRWVLKVVELVDQVVVVVAEVTTVVVARDVETTVICGVHTCATTLLPTARKLAKNTCSDLILKPLSVVCRSCG